MSHPDCILEEVNFNSNSNSNFNQTVVKAEESCVELCTPDYRADNCECFSKQEQKIKELQAELDRQRKIQEAIRIKLNDCINKANEQQKIVDEKYKDYVNANNKYQTLVNQYHKLKYDYDELNGVYQNDFTKLFDIILNPSFNRF